MVVTSYATNGGRACVALPVAAVPPTWTTFPRLPLGKRSSRRRATKRPELCEADRTHNLLLTIGGGSCLLFFENVTISSFVSVCLVCVWKRYWLTAAVGRKDGRKALFAWDFLEDRCY